MVIGIIVIILAVLYEIVFTIALYYAAKKEGASRKEAPNKLNKFDKGFSFADESAEVLEPSSEGGASLGGVAILFIHSLCCFILGGAVTWLFG